MGNIYVTGDTQGGLDGNQNAGYSYDAFLVKYDANGNKLWTRQFDTRQDESAHSVATDGMGNAYVTGSSGSGGEVGFGVSLVEYDADGKKLWMRRLWPQFGAGPPASAWGRGVSIDGSGGVYVTGSTEGAFPGYDQNAGGAFLARFPAEP